VLLAVASCPSLPATALVTTGGSYSRRITGGLKAAWGDGNEEDDRRDPFFQRPAYTRSAASRKAKAERVAVTLSYCQIIHYGCTASLSFTRGAPTRLGSSVADAGSAYVRLHPSPARTSTTAAFHPARGADPEMHPCPASVLSWTLCSGPHVAQSSVGANQLQSRPAQELGALHVTARH
jgi:hypothetical protein